ncbi:MAG: S41 family peptidase [Bacteroidetes bacterium]|nr:S41 family peptidase [Bacteroidota bacterium]
MKNLNHRPHPRLRTRYLLTLGLPLGLVLMGAKAVKDDYFEISKQLEIMQSAFRELNLYYVDELAPGDLMETGIKAMLDQLDPYTRYFPESKMEDVRFMQTGEYGGVGASIEQTKEGHTIIVDLLEGEPADKAGILLGDRLLAVDGRSLEGLSQEQIGDMLQGATGTEVKLQVARPGASTPLEVALTRSKVKVPDVPYVGMLTEKTGYLTLSSFTKTSSTEVRKALMTLTASLGAEQVVLDLRGNGGGLLREAITIVNLFVGKGEEVVSTRGKTPDWNKSYKTFRSAQFPDLPLAVLVDRSSASASEIVAGTLQDLDRAVVLGEESFGKGLVQQTKNLAYGTRLKVTVAKYYTPSGRCVQRLDYSNRDDEGTVHALADSTLQTYYTKGGRTVLEGRGVIPDIELESPEANYVLAGLIDNHVLFDFAVHQRSQWNVPEFAGDFELTDSMWESFVTYVASMDEAPYASLTQQAFESLLSKAEEELLVEANDAALSQLKLGLQANVRTDLERHGSEIREALEHELVIHLYNTTGEFEHGLRRDAVTLKAVELLESGAYLDVLSGPQTTKRR